MINMVNTGRGINVTESDTGIEVSAATEGSGIDCNVVPAGGLNVRVVQGSFSPTPTGDPHWANVVRLFNADQGLGDLDAVCQKTGVTLPQRGGLEEISATTKYLSGGSYSAPGTGNNTNQGWRLALGTGTNPSDSNLDLRNIDWTVEAWVRPQAVFSGYRGIFNLARTDMVAVGLVLNNSNRLELWLNQVAVAQSSTQLTNGQWAHVAAVRSGTTVKLYINGVETNSITGNASFSGGLGEWGENLGGFVLDNVGFRFPFGGFIDELRITKSVARYTANFTPPAEKFPTS